MFGSYLIHVAFKSLQRALAAHVMRAHICASSQGAHWRQQHVRKRNDDDDVRGWLCAAPCCWNRLDELKRNNQELDEEKVSSNKKPDHELKSN